MYFGAAYFKAKYFEADFFGRVGVVAPPAAAIDPYAWFPGDPGPGPPRKRYEEYAREEELPKKKKRHRHPLRVPKALQVLDFPPPFTPPPVYEPPPAAPAVQLPWDQPIERPPLEAPTTAAALPPAEDPGAHWSSYAHLPYSADQENEELQIILAAMLHRQ